MSKKIKEAVEGYINPKHTSSIVGIFVVNAEPKIIHTAGQGQYSCQNLTPDETKALNTMINNGELAFKIQENCLEPLPDGRELIFAKHAVYNAPQNRPPGWY